MSPLEDAWPPVIAPGWNEPIALPPPVNTAGVEDSPFITPNGESLYFFFTPSPAIPPERQVLDGVSGIWTARRDNQGWALPQQVPLALPDELNLNGCPFVSGNSMVFCSARAGNYGDVDLYTAELADSQWVNWQNWGVLINVDFNAGEMHLTADGQWLYFGSDLPGGFGGLDLWVSQREGDVWREPVNLGPMVNTPGDENRPFVSPDGLELWFDRGEGGKGYPGPAIFRSMRQPETLWGPPEEIVSSFAGEPSLTDDGQTLYYVHPYFTANLDRMIEADIFVTHKVTKSKGE